MTIEIMIDFETLDTTPDSVILSVGAVKFDPSGTEVTERLQLLPMIDEQSEVYGRTISETTLKWWETQSPEAIERAMGEDGRIPFKDCMEQLAKFYWNIDGIWSNGATFDISIAESAWRQLGINIPYQFWVVRDCRTLYKIANVNVKDDGYVTSHIAVEDAERQAFIAQKAYQKLIAAGFTHLA